MKESIYIAQRLSVNGHGEAILSPQRLAKTNIVPAFWSSWAGRREWKRKNGTPSSISSSLLCTVTLVSPRCPSAWLQFMAPPSPLCPGSRLHLTQSPTLWLGHNSYRTWPSLPRAIYSLIGWTELVAEPSFFFLSETIVYLSGNFQPEMCGHVCELE